MKTSKHRTKGKLDLKRNNNVVDPNLAIDNPYNLKHHAFHKRKQIYLKVVYSRTHKTYISYKSDIFLRFLDVQAIQNYI